MANELDAFRAERNQLRQRTKELEKLFVPPWHFYSPIPDLEEVRGREHELFETVPKILPAIDLAEEEQLKLISILGTFYVDLPFAEEKAEGLRYSFNNPNFLDADAIYLYLMIRYLQPKRIIEVGSGFSSCVMLDTNQIFFGNSINLMLIEPFPQLLRSLVLDGDLEKVILIEKKLQDIPLNTFQSLEANDILFVDSTHVSKINSDVNYLFFEVLPVLGEGVYVHLHDIFYPFEYPKDWIYEGRAWNEAYVLRAFLQYNRSFSVSLFTHWLERVRPDVVRQHLPLCLRKRASSIWLRKR